MSKKKKTTKKDTSSDASEKKQVKVAEKVYSFPTLRKSAKGKNKEEALKKVK